jgi:hypothetical protein
MYQDIIMPLGKENEKVMNLIKKDAMNSGEIIILNLKNETDENGLLKKKI